MNFATPTRDRGLTFEQRIVRDTERLRWKLEKSAQRRKKRNGAFWDDETAIPPKPTMCTVGDCDRKVRALGLCERDYKRQRRAMGFTH